MKYELIYSAAKSGHKEHPLLFIHGMSHAAWCWSEHFVPYFNQLGYDCYALSLRGHGASEGAEKIRWTSVKDYLQDVTWAIEQTGNNPIVIGHSMGAFVLQKYLLQKDDLSAFVSIAGVPHTGMWRGAINLMKKYPWQFLLGNLTMSTAPFIHSRKIVKEMCFTPDASDTLVAKTQDRLQPESFRAFLDMVLLSHHSARKLSTPSLFLHSNVDVVLFEREMKNSAAAFGADYEAFDDVGHDMFLDTRWEKVAVVVAEWLAKKKL